MSDETEIVDPPWFDPNHGADFSSKDWDYATAMGKSAAALSTMPWGQLESILQSLWREMKGYPPWEQSRVPMYQAWKLERMKHPGITRV
ncbi:hypothetical protein LVB87_12980 [Lysobacter sp. KIS68-7]|uniref:hypothetical protein n=1 Tax=Lysobacter sp. KIS68-7 TaxID=2904252 RepID=UPI001E5CA71A|nr:hypothetical protein [Lysobacter sp. KIS68-7]UHQ19088.1 hypothetical protein LVB87_12980 [Lysobacter sp. KIS68-7]